jgi:hypothetical protein
MVGIKGFRITVRKKNSEEDRKYIEIPKAVRDFFEEGKEYICELREIQ